MNEQYAEPKKGLSTGGIIAIVLGAVIIVGGGGFCLLGAGILLPAVNRARENAMQIMSATQARAIAQAVQQYESDKGTALPRDGWTQLLLNEGLITPDMLILPSDDTITPAYFLLPVGALDGQTGLPTNVLVYEHPGAFDRGGNVVYTDGMASFINEPEFTTLIDNLQNPDGTPFAPHRN